MRQYECGFATWLAQKASHGFLSPPRESKKRSDLRYIKANTVGAIATRVAREEDTRVVVTTSRSNRGLVFSAIYRLHGIKIEKMDEEYVSNREETRDFDLTYRRDFIICTMKLRRKQKKVYILGRNNIIMFPRAPQSTVSRSEIFAVPFYIFTITSDRKRERDRKSEGGG